ncbi:hypothetical protein EDB83DRAFT_2317393 [Lactarius deliciosus]|nr:hypothetical protein EDB83DRAFT_2317393 [Lactarius deliciosus]
MWTQCEISSLVPFDAYSSHQLGNLETVECVAQVSKRLPGCKHSGIMACDNDPTDFECKKSCGGQTTCCSQTCKSQCHECQEVTRNNAASRAGAVPPSIQSRLVTAGVAVLVTTIVAVGVCQSTVAIAKVLIVTTSVVVAATATAVATTDLCYHCCGCGCSIRRPRCGCGHVVAVTISVVTVTSLTWWQWGIMRSLASRGGRWRAKEGDDSGVVTVVLH